MNSLAYIVIGALVLAVVGGAIHVWQHRNDWDDDGGPYL